MSTQPAERDMNLRGGVMRTLPHARIPRRCGRRFQRPRRRPAPVCPTPSPRGNVQLGRRPPRNGRSRMRSPQRQARGRAGARPVVTRGDHPSRSSQLPPAAHPPIRDAQHRGPEPGWPWRRSTTRPQFPDAPPQRAAPGRRTEQPLPFPDGHRRSPVDLRGRRADGPDAHTLRYYERAGHRAAGAARARGNPRAPWRRSSTRSRLPRAGRLTSSALERLAWSA